MKPRTKAARALTLHKIGLARTITGYGVDVVMCDADTVWQRDPTGYFAGWAPWLRHPIIEQPALTLCNPYPCQNPRHSTDSRQVLQYVTRQVLQQVTCGRPQKGRMSGDLHGGGR